MNGKYAVYCIILTKYRLVQGLAMFRSLERNSKGHSVFFLCMDPEILEVMNKLNLKNANLISLDKIENKELLKVKEKRKLNEYCWTLKPYLIEYLLHSIKDLSRVTYLDADLFFFNDPDVIFNDAAYCSVLLTKHDYPVELDQMAATYGKFNSGFLSFTNSSCGIECVSWWKKKCLARCSEVPESGQFGDQKYLDAMPFFFKRVCVVKTPGVNIAPWNHVKYDFTENGGKIYTNGKPLIFYHFSGLRLLDNRTVALTMQYEKNIIPVVYKPYFSELQRAADDINAACPGFESFYIEDNRKDIATVIKINEI